MYERGARRWLVLALFLGPSLVGVALFVAGPIVASLALAFTSWDLLTPADLRGPAQLRAAVARRGVLGRAAPHADVPRRLRPAGAGDRPRRRRGAERPRARRGVFRAIYFLPVVTSWVAVALVWKWLLNPQFGLVNAWLAQLGVQGPAWLFDPNWAMASVILTSVWKDTGFVMVILLAGLQGIPREYYEASAIDGASRAQQLRFVTVPLLAPAIFFALTISLINSFQVFDQVYVMTGGGPAGATTVLVERIVAGVLVQPHGLRLGDVVGAVRADLRDHLRVSRGCSAGGRDAPLARARSWPRLAIVAGAFVMLVPFAWMLSTSLKPARRCWCCRRSFVPEEPTSSPTAA
jgi:multiple sugar transport system permease protein